MTHLSSEPQKAQSTSDLLLSFVPVGSLFIDNLFINITWVALLNDDKVFEANKEQSHHDYT